MYLYKVVEILRVVDADTVDCRISLGFGMTAAFRFRLAHVDAPEMYGRYADARGRAAYEFARQWLTERADRLIVRTFKGAQSTVGIGDGAFGRWLAAFLTDDGEDLAAALIAAGHVKGGT